MAQEVQVVQTPGDLDNNWDNIATCYFQRKEFLAHLHQYNPCRQRYYELFNDDRLVAGAVVYTLKINVFTFSGLKTNAFMQVIGLPASVSATSVIGGPDHSLTLINEILAKENGIILGMNMPADQNVKGTVLMRTLPTILFDNKFGDFESYMNALRHPYRRRLRIIMAKAEGVDYVVTKCNDFTDQHYKLYLEIMKRTKTRLETLSCDLFKNLPENFTLGSEYHNGSLLAWHTLCYDGNVLYFFFGGMDYEQRDRFQSYYNNLLNILKTGIANKSIRLDFGQTAEIAKMRLGGTAEERSMFVYHKNPLVLSLFKLAKPLITYTRKSIKPKVFK